MSNNFIVIDTEGSHILTEIAIINHTGQLIYEAFVQEQGQSATIAQQAKSLTTILEDFLQLTQQKLLIFHYAKHDIAVLQRSFHQIHHQWMPTQFICTVELTQHIYPNLISYSLEYLSKYLRLKHENHYFNPQMAHSARYDAIFTYYLYHILMEQQHKQSLQGKPNPYGESRVDTPFQHHIDLQSIYHKEFLTLTAILNEIKQDGNHQSKGVVVIGEAGTGKTHLMMRLANELLNNNRLLFIRQPNNPNAVLYHTYSRMLESFVEKVPDSEYSQLEHLLAKSFSKLVIEFIKRKEEPTKREQEILDMLSVSYLDIYKALGAEGTDKKRRNWEYIEKKTVDWWDETYGSGGYSNSIIKGLIKFCYYSDANRRELVRRWLSGNELDSSELEKLKLPNWSEEINKEEFSLEAIRVFSKLSIIDEPLIIIFDQLEGLKYNERLLLQFGEAVKEIFTHVPNSLIILNLFPDRWEHFQHIFDGSIIDRISQYKILLNLPEPEALCNILILRLQNHDIELNDLFDNDELAIILNQTSIRAVLNCAADYYRYKINEIPLPKLYLSFEEQIKQELAAIKDDIALLKNKLNLEKTPPTVLQSTIDKQEVTEYITLQHELINQNYHKNVIISDTDDIGKLNTIIEAVKQFYSLEIDYLRMGKKKLPEHIVIKLPIKNTIETFFIGFLQVNGVSFATRIKNLSELVIMHKDIHFGIFRDSRIPPVTGKAGKSEIEKLNYTDNAKFIDLIEDDRIAFELVYKILTDILNKEIDIELKTGLLALNHYLQQQWSVNTPLAKTVKLLLKTVT